MKSEQSTVPEKIKKIPRLALAAFLALGISIGANNVDVAFAADESTAPASGTSDRGDGIAEDYTDAEVSENEQIIPAEPDRDTTEIGGDSSTPGGDNTEVVPESEYDQYNPDLEQQYIDEAARLGVSAGDKTDPIPPQDGLSNEEGGKPNTPKTPSGQGAGGGGAENMNARKKDDGLPVAPLVAGVGAAAGAALILSEGRKRFDVRTKNSRQTVAPGGKGRN